MSLPHQKKPSESKPVTRSAEKIFIEIDLFLLYLKHEGYIDPSQYLEARTLAAAEQNIISLKDYLRDALGNEYTPLVRLCNALKP